MTTSEGYNNEWFNNIHNLYNKHLSKLIEIRNEIDI